MVDTVSLDNPAGRDLDLVGETLSDRYRIVDQLGRGGMGAVFRAEDQQTGQIHAIKVLRQSLIDSPEMFNRFRREAQVTSSIGHPNIVTISDFGRTSEGAPYFVMEYLEGLDLGALLRRDGPMPWRRVFGLALQICSALQAAHAAGILHRDVKPENFILLDSSKDDFIKVLDFGIAKRTDREGSVITRVGAFVGTPEYMSPEQARGDPLDARVDVYGVGVLLYHLIVGDVPFRGASEFEVLSKHAKEPPVPPTEANPHVRLPRDAEAVILRALAKAPEERHRAMWELAAALQGVLDEYAQRVTTSAPRLQMQAPAPPPPSTAWPAVIAGVGLGIGLLAAAGYFLLS